ncbi:MAG TPA: hydrogenase maturation nickel metallochaperone HypA [Terriglobales bacterium]
MHEMGIANSILHAVKTEAARYPGCQPQKIGVRIGELAAVDPDALQFCFDVLKQEAGFNDLELEVEFRRRRHHCDLCNDEFDVKDYDLHCPKCRQPTSLCVSGDELELAYLEVEEHEPSSA